METGFQLDEFTSKLVAAGVVTVSVIFTQSGVDSYARSVRIHPRLNIDPTMSWSLEELPSAFDKVAKHLDFKGPESPPSSSRRVDEGVSLIPIRGEPTSRFDNMTLAEARAIVKSRELDTRVHFGVKNILPRDSLVEEDCQRPLSEAYARMVLVADEIGAARAVAKIAADRQYHIRGADASDLTEWWNQATVEQRISLLSRAKVHKVSNTLSKLPSHRLAGLGGELRCPFRGQLAQMEQH